MISPGSFPFLLLHELLCFVCLSGIACNCVDWKKPLSSVKRRNYTRGREECVLKYHTGRCTAISYADWLMTCHRSRVQNSVHRSVIFWLAKGCVNIQVNNYFYQNNAEMAGYYALPISVISHDDTLSDVKCTGVDCFIRQTKPLPYSRMVNQNSVPFT